MVCLIGDVITHDNFLCVPVTLLWFFIVRMPGEYFTEEGFPLFGISDLVTFLFLSLAMIAPFFLSLLLCSHLSLFCLHCSFPLFVHEIQ